MSNTEKIMLALVALGIVAVLMYRGVPGASPEVVEVGDAPASQAGPAFLTYNLPWANNPPVGNVLPSRSMGQAGQVGQRGSFQNFSPTDPCC